MSPLTTHAFNWLPVSSTLDTDLGGGDIGINKVWSLSSSRFPSRGGAREVKAVTIQKGGVRGTEKGDLV